jgi:hypothetical protein
MIDDRLDHYNDRGHVGVLHCTYVSALLVGLFIDKTPQETSLHVNAKNFGQKHAQYIGLTEK